ncbi:Uncharacterised protein [Vibrio cholerae]|nr:Uncharacterised protein [Vibrio cholerae]
MRYHVKITITQTFGVLRGVDRADLHLNPHELQIFLQRNRNSLRSRKADKFP